MNIGFYNTYREYNKNKMFQSPSSPIGDDLMYPFFYLSQQLKKNGHRVTTIDTDELKNFDAVVFMDFPGLKNKYLKKSIKNDFKNIYLIAIESPIVKPDNLDLKNHKYFKKIFTWSDKLIDNKKYFKINYSHKIPENLDFNISKKEKLCAMIASNKFTPHPNELYSERVGAIRWFEKNHPEGFDLFGIGWDKYYFYGKFFGINLLRLNRLKLLAKILGPNYPSWKGEVKSKNGTYKKYKFAICYENAKDFNGYITEKIVDCFFAGCVPVYLGAPNITSHIPKTTFIDKRNFNNYEGLYKYLKNMNNEEYSGFLNAIKNFIKSDEFYPFSADYFAETIIREII